MKILDEIPLWFALALALSLGLAPFSPEPHVVEKLRMLVAGQLVRPLDIFDLALHGLPWLLLAARLGRLFGRRRGRGGRTEE